jgi:sporulation protein YlmC with PRC-barrel domain
MLVPFGTRVVDKNGKGVGTVSRVVLHSGSRQASGLVVHQGVLDRRQIVVPLAKVASFGDEVRLTLSASDLAGLDLYNAESLHAESLQLMPDQWEMPVGFDQREFFLVGGDGWTEAVLPFERTSATVSGTPAFVKDGDTPAEPREPVIAAEEEVFDKSGQKVGEVNGVELDPASGRIVRIIVRRGTLFRGETAIPASLIAKAGGRITLSATVDEVKKLERA